MVSEDLQQEWMELHWMNRWLEVPQNVQYDQFSVVIRINQHQKDKMQHNLKQSLSSYP